MKFLNLVMKASIFDKVLSLSTFHSNNQVPIFFIGDHEGESPALLTLIDRFS